ncbi:hypothetical protein FQR65_LT20777 [Abscondita terminalis]|nr:hypothetical protein FQR65_LT20777 [Abscondita terminalis]
MGSATSRATTAAVKKPLEPGLRARRLSGGSAAAVAAPPVGPPPPPPTPAARSVNRGPSPTLPACLDQGRPGLARTPRTAALLAARHGRLRPERLHQHRWSQCPTTRPASTTRYRTCVSACRESTFWRRSGSTHRRTAPRQQFKVLEKLGRHDQVHQPAEHRHAHPGDCIVIAPAEASRTCPVTMRCVSATVREPAQGFGRPYGVRSAKASAPKVQRRIMVGTLAAVGGY